jgi:hypothetical protein
MEGAEVPDTTPLLRRQGPGQSYYIHVIIKKLKKEQIQERQFPISKKKKKSNSGRFGKEKIYSMFRGSSRSGSVHRGCDGRRTSGQQWRQGAAKVESEQRATENTGAPARAGDREHRRRRAPETRHVSAAFDNPGVPVDWYSGIFAGS